MSYAIEIILLKLMVVIAIFMVIYTSVYIVDLTSIKEIGHEQVNCVDENNNVCIDVWCSKEITCSYLGIASDKRCSEVEK